MFDEFGYLVVLGVWNYRNFLEYFVRIQCEIYVYIFDMLLDSVFKMKKKSLVIYNIFSNLFLNILDEQISHYLILNQYIFEHKSIILYMSDDLIIF